MHEVPALLADGKLLSRVAELENLPADAASLPQKYLHRAALVLAKAGYQPLVIGPPPAAAPSGALQLASNGFAALQQLAPQLADELEGK